MLRDTLQAVLGVGAGQRLLYWAEEPTAEPAIDLPEEITVRLQVGPDLGARLEHACSELLEEPNDRVVVIGSDCPELGADTLEKAFTALESAALTIGPTTD